MLLLPAGSIDYFSLCDTAETEMLDSDISEKSMVSVNVLVLELGTLAMDS